jgi:uncharacterized cupredoxin-like copper-binding protein
MHSSNQETSTLSCMSAQSDPPFGHMRKLLFILSRYLVWILCCFLLIRCSNSNETTVQIIASDHGWVLPDTIHAGMSHIVFKNTDTEIHEAMFVKLPGGMSSEDYIRKVKDGIDFPKDAIDYSGPGLTSPGKEVSIWLHLDPGEYLLACWYRGHLTSDPIQRVIVENFTAHNITPPKADAVIKLIDFRFEIEGKLNKGEQVVQVETIGPSMHEVDIFRLNEGKTLKDVKEWHKNGKDSPPPVEALGGVLDNHDLNRKIWIKTNFAPGNYVLWCDMPMIQNYQGSGVSPSHADAGMVKEFTIED